MRRAALLLAILLAATSAFANAKITIHNLDDPNKGFNDPTPVAPVGGNPGTTLGAQRLNVFQRAADIWGSILNSDVEIVIDATFRALPCDANSAVLGAAGPLKVLTNFPNAPLQNVWYPKALADALAHKDLAPGTSDIMATFSLSFDSGGCPSPLRFYYGLDHNHGNNVDLLIVLLHEFGHGLGFVGTESLTNGLMMNNEPSVFALHLFDNTVGLHWDQMSSVQRRASATNTFNLVWDGASTSDAASKLLIPVETMTVDAPAAIARDFEIGRANFGSDPGTSGVSGRLVAPQQVARLRRVTADACTAFANPSEVAGNIALVDRGNCPYTVKAENVQAAGAIGMVVIDNTKSTCIPPGISGIETSIHIPIISVTYADGQALKAQLASGVHVSFRTDPSRVSGADSAGRVRLYTPCALQGGSSVFHWDTTATPNLLMEPNISSDLRGVDITVNQLIDIGWTTTSP
jgi:hypothetical protein